jgi:hypothetical protein
MRTNTTAIRVNLALLISIAACDSPHDPNETRVNTYLEITGTVLLDGIQLAGASVWAETFTCRDQWGNSICTWDTGGRTVVFDRSLTDDRGNYVLSWTMLCPPAHHAVPPSLRVRPEGVDDHQIHEYRVTSSPSGPIECRSGPQQRDFRIELRNHG